MERKDRTRAGDTVEARKLVTIHSEPLHIPDRHTLIHLQFRRFAGCPVCDLHLHSIVRRHQQILAASVREVVVFHSSVEDLLPHAGALPFAVVADPDRRLYRAFGVESSPRALLNPRAWLPVLRGICRTFGGILRGQQSIPPLNPRGGRFGLPAEFLISTDGRVLASKYGSHAYDQWSVDELLALAAKGGVLGATTRSARQPIHQPCRKELKRWNT